MFKRVLIANRGEIALRVIRCLREMEIESVVVYSTADKNTLPVMMATKSVCIGPAPSQESYLKQDTLIEVALKTGCDAIHPGYGFLSENAEFAKKCADNNIVFIGPDAELITKMGDKQNARSIMIANNIPVVPGSDGLLNNIEDAKKTAERIGYPVLLKASAGGGGKGMRRAYSPEELEEAFNTAKAEAKASFGNDDMYMEKLIINPHHIEIQIMADKMGNVISLGERDCSIQKNNQKMLEESPAWSVSSSMRDKMNEIARRVCTATGYYSAGTVEFVVDNSENFYFIEMNTRIQVEHPVTEEVTGLDLIKEQIRIAANRELSVKQEDIVNKGHAIECRINALTPGKVNFVHFPNGYGVRVDSYLYNGCEINPYYDSMIAKVIVSANTRLEAIRRMRRALEELIIDGIQTNAEIMHLITYHPEFIKGSYTTSFWQNNSETILEWKKEGSVNGNS